jgi:hypothetical protein
VNRYDEDKDMQYRGQVINKVISQHPTTSNIVLVEDVWSRTNRVLVLASSRRQSHQKYIAGVCEIDAKNQ